MFLKILQISVESTCVADLRACNFIQKRLQQNCFPVKFLRTSFSTEQLWWLLFKIRNGNNLFIDVSVISVTHSQSLIIYNFSQSQTNLKIHPLTKSLFQYSIFVTDLEQPPFFLRSGLNINNFAVLYHFLKTQIFSEIQLNIYFFDQNVPCFIKRPTFFQLSPKELITISKCAIQH